MLQNPLEKHCAATVILVTQEQPRKTLLLWHKKLQVWIPPGGHVEPHENPFEAALREVQEETGLDISSQVPHVHVLDDRAALIPLPRWILEEQIATHGDKPAHCHIDHVYVVEIPFQEAIHDPNESEGVRWITEDEIDDTEMFENCRVLLREIFSS